MPLRMVTKSKSGSKRKKNIRTTILDLNKNEYLKEVLELRKTVPNWDRLFSNEISKDAQVDDWTRIDILGNPLSKKYSWAIPGMLRVKCIFVALTIPTMVDPTALNILSHFSPLVEIGAGKGVTIKLIRIY